jgi:hypothetical protein
MPRPATITPAAAPTGTEHEHQAALFTWAAYAKQRYPELEFLYAIPNGGHRLRGVAGKMKAEGVQPGVFDVGLDVARGRWFGMRIEMKVGRNRLTPAQERWRVWYERQGYYAAVCYSWEEAARTLEQYLALKPTMVRRER